MARQKLFGRLAGALHSDEEEETPQDIINQISAQVKADLEEEVAAVGDESILSKGWGGKGEVVFIINLTPLYDKIGKRTGRIAEGLRDTCKSEFTEHVDPKNGRSSFEREGFFMRFHRMSNNEGLGLAATIVNKIGTKTFGDSFQNMDFPELLVTADADDVVDADGNLNMDKAKAVIESGGIPMLMDEPDDHAPEWVKLHWGKAQAEVQLLEMQAEAERKSPEWMNADGEPRDRSRSQKKRGMDRRAARRTFDGEDRRQHFDRRGRGF